MTLLNTIARIDIRHADKSDVPAILQLIRELAEYEHLSQEVVATEEGLTRTLFGPKTYAEVLLAREGGKAVGFCLFFHNYSTFLGKPGIYIEDIFVQDRFRGRNIGKALFTRVAQIAYERQCGRLEWSVLNWNKPAIEFYAGMGAKPMDEWMVYRLTEEKFTNL